MLLATPQWQAPLPWQVRHAITHLSNSSRGLAGALCTLDQAGTRIVCNDRGQPYSDSARNRHHSACAGSQLAHSASSTNNAGHTVPVGFINGTWLSLCISPLAGEVCATERQAWWCRNTPAEEQFGAGAAAIRFVRCGDGKDAHARAGVWRDLHQSRLRPGSQPLRRHQNSRRCNASYRKEHEIVTGTQICLCQAINLG